MKSSTLLGVTVSALFVAACAESPVLVDGDEIEVLEFEVQGLDGLVTLREAEIEVAARGHSGGRFMDFQRLHMEYRLAGETEWREMDLAAHGHAFGGHHTFTTSGEYEMRLTGVRHGRRMMEVFHNLPDHVEVARARMESGPFVIEFESFPGHMQMNERAMMRFWVHRDGEPVAGLVGEIGCTGEASMTEVHHAVEVEAGVYEAEHMSAMAGGLEVMFGFTFEGVMHAAGFHTRVGH